MTSRDEGPQDAELGAADPAQGPAEGPAEGDGAGAGATTARTVVPRVAPARTALRLDAAAAEQGAAALSGPAAGAGAQAGGGSPALSARLLRGLPPRLLIGAALIAFATLFSVAGFRHVAALRYMEAGLNDVLRVVFSPYSEVQDPRISVLTLTEDTLAQFPYRSPVDREFLARVILRLNKAGVKAVGIDILFDQATEPRKDAALVNALRQFSGPKVVAWADARAGLRPAQEDFLNQFVERSGATPGFATVRYDGDGVVRSFASNLAGTPVRSFPASLIEGTGAQPRIEEGLIDWRRETVEGAPAFQTLPAHTILNPRLPDVMLQRWFDGRFVLIGADLEQTDRHQTSLAADPTVSNRTQPGVLLHAHVLAQMLDGRAARNFDVGTPGGAALVALAALIGAALGLKGGAFGLRVLAFLLASAAWLGFAAILADLGGPYPPIAPPMLALAFCFGVGGVADAVIAARDKAFIRQAFSHYLEPAMVDRLARDRDSLKLGGERREISFIFTDIAGFTEMSERLPPETLTALLNEYFDGMSDVLAAHDGMIDKFIGDAVVALFGAAQPDPSHAANAVRAAAAMDAFAEDFRARHAEIGLGVTRIGVHTGVASVGNFGGRRRFDFTAMGDAMNTAARLESINKTLGTRVTVSGAARAAAMTEGFEAAGIDAAALPPLRRAGRLALKGKAGFTEAWNLARGETASPEAIAAYEAAYARMLAGEGATAEAAFAAVLAAHPLDPLAALHLRRLRAGATGDEVSA